MNSKIVIMSSCLHETPSFVHAPISHVAVSDIDATYSAYVAANHNPSSKTNISNRYAQNNNTHTNYNNQKYGPNLFCGGVLSPYATIGASRMKQWGVLAIVGKQP